MLLQCVVKPVFDVNRHDLVDHTTRCFTPPFKRPIKPVYIRKLVAFIDEANENNEQA